jgi:IS30 family transposase
LESPEKEKKKARYLKDSGLSNQQIADLLNKEKSTISGQLSRLKSLD